MPDSQSAFIKPQGEKPICVSFNAGIDPATSSVLMAALSEQVNAGHDEIHLLLNTPGGTVQEGIASYNFIRGLPARIVTYNIGNVNSMGNVVYQSGDYRICTPTASFMFHGVGFDVTGVARFELKDLRERTLGIERDQAMISEIMVRHTPLNNSDVDSLFLEMAFLDPQEALKRGITDEVTEVRLPEGLPIIQLVFQR